MDTIMNEDLLRAYKQRDNERWEREKREAAKKLARDTSFVEEHRDEVANALVDVFRDSRGDQKKASDGLLARRERLGFDLTRIDPDAVCDNEHVMGVLVAQFGRFHPEKMSDPKTNPHERIKKAVTGILRHIDHSGLTNI